MINLVKKYPKLSIALLLVSVLVVIDELGSDNNADVVTTTTNPLSDLFGSNQYGGIEDCSIQMKQKNVSVINIPIECSFIQSDCDSLVSLQEQLSEFESEVNLKLAVPKDAADIYKEFLDYHKYSFGFEEFPSDPFMLAWQELILTYKYLRVALIEEDDQRVNEIRVKASDLSMRVSEMCSKIPPRPSDS